MAMTELFATTNRDIQARVTDTYYKASPVMRRLKAMGSVRKKGGRTLVEPLLVGASNGGAYSGMAPFTASHNDIHTGAEYDWCSYRRIAVLSAMDDFKNSGDSAVVNIWNSSCEEAAMGITDDVISDFFGDPTTAIAGFNVTPFEQIADDGNTYSVGGVSSDDATLWQGNVTSLAGGAMALADIETVDLNCSEGDEAPTDYATTKAVYKQVWGLMQTAQRFVGSDKNAGFKNFTFNDALFHFDSHIMATGGGYTGKRIYGMNLRHIKMWIGKGNEFAFVDKTPTNADGLVAMIKLYVQFGTGGRRYQGVLHNFA